MGFRDTGLKIVAIGASTPELATCVVAALKKKVADITIGNVVGSNIFNLLGIVGVTALAVPLSAPGISMVDPLIMIGFVVVLLPLLWSGFLLKRWEGTVLLITYIGHTLYHWTTG